MNTNSIIVVAGEPNSIFIEIFLKVLKKIKNKNPIILVASLNLVRLQMKALKIKRSIKLLDAKKLHRYNLDNKKINLININFDQTKPFEKIHDFQ